MKLDPTITPANARILFGVVEDINDPEKSGKVRVRVFGIHDDNIKQGTFSGISTEELPWFPVMSPVNSANLSGIGSSPLGLLPGTTVAVTFIDEYLRSGIVVGSFSNPYQKLALPSAMGSGFQDPTGFYPTREGNSLSDLNSTELGAQEDVTVQLRNDTLDMALNGNALGLPEDNSPEYSLYKMLHNDEGYKNFVYYDSEKYPTVGVGHLIARVRNMPMPEANKILSKQIGREIVTTGGPGYITAEESQMLFEKDLQRETLEMLKYANVRAALEAAGDNQPRVWALKNMSFQMGGYGLSKFDTSLGLMAQGKWAEAGEQLKKSKWFRQTKGRAIRVISTIVSGNLAAYGVKPKEQP